MTTFNFAQEGNGYAAYITIEEASALHVERKQGNIFSIGMKSFDEDSHQYAYVNNDHYDKSVIDCDLVAEVYPKYIKLYSDSPVTVAAVS